MVGTTRRVKGAIGTFFLILGGPPMLGQFRHACHDIRQQPLRVRLGQHGVGDLNPQDEPEAAVHGRNDRTKIPAWKFRTGRGAA